MLHHKVRELTQKCQLKLQLQCKSYLVFANVSLLTTNKGDAASLIPLANMQYGLVCLL